MWSVSISVMILSMNLTEKKELVSIKERRENGKLFFHYRKLKKVVYIRMWSIKWYYERF